CWPLASLRSAVSRSSVLDQRSEWLLGIWCAEGATTSKGYAESEGTGYRSQRGQNDRLGEEKRQSNREGERGAETQCRDPLSNVAGESVAASAQFHDGSLRTGHGSSEANVQE